MKRKSVKHKKAKTLKRLVRGTADDAVELPARTGSMTSSMTFADSIDGLSQEQRDIFFPVLENLTDELLDELEAAGMPRERLLEARGLGWKYNRKRNSFMTGEAASF